MQLAIAFDGTTGLLQHNPRLIDKFDDITREISAINAKRKKTEADEAERDRLEWFGSLYHAQDIGIYVPAAWSGRDGLSMAWSGMAWRVAARQCGAGCGRVRSGTAWPGRAR